MPQVVGLMLIAFGIGYVVGAVTEIFRAKVNK